MGTFKVANIRPPWHVVGVAHCSLTPATACLMRASQLVSAFHQRLSTRPFTSPVPVHECRVVRSIATSLTVSKETPKQKDEQPEPQRKEPKPRFFAVLVGREGPKIYLSWKQCEPHVRL